MSVNKVVYGSKTLIDLSDSTVVPGTLFKGSVAYNAKGEKIVGTMEEITFTDDGAGNVTISGVSPTYDGNGNLSIA